MRYRAIEVLADLMPSEMTQSEADEILAMLEYVKLEVQCSITKPSNADTDYSPNGSQASTSSS